MSDAALLALSAALGALSGGLAGLISGALCAAPGLGLLVLAGAAVVRRRKLELEDAERGREPAE